MEGERRSRGVLGVLEWQEEEGVSMLVSGSGRGSLVRGSMRRFPSACFPSRVFGVPGVGGYHSGKIGHLCVCDVFSISSSKWGCTHPAIHSFIHPSNYKVTYPHIYRPIIYLSIHSSPDVTVRMCSDLFTRLSIH